MRASGLVTTLLAASFMATGLPPATSAPKPVTASISLVVPAYTPAAKSGANDDYRCSLIDPKFKKSGFLTSVHFLPGDLKTAHHAILFRIPRSQAAVAREKDGNGKGWTCFGGPGVGSALDGGSWLSAWAPGAGQDAMPKGTGVPVSAGDLIVVQMHYNLLRASGAGQSPASQIRLTFTTKELLPMTNALFVAPVNIPCPDGVTGPLCDRAASIKELGERFGSQAVVTVQSLELLCGRWMTGPKIGVEADCVRTAPTTGVIRRASAHMHMLGRSMKVSLNPGTPNEQLVFEESNYNFDYQKATTLTPPVTLRPGDKIKVSCTFDPALRSMIPELQKLQPRFVTWGEGSSDEMCLAILQMTPN